VHDIDVNIRLKMEPDKEYLPFSFVLLLPKEKCCWCTQNYLLCKNVIVTRTCANWFKWFKNNDFYISDKERSKRSAAVKEDELRIDGKNVENDVFFIVKKIVKNRQELLYRPNNLLFFLQITIVIVNFYYCNYLDYN